MKEKKRKLDEVDDTPYAKRRLQGEMFADEVKVWGWYMALPPQFTHRQRNQIHNELSVESIIRRRSFDG
jgi:hypothetical protein